MRENQSNKANMIRMFEFYFQLRSIAKEDFNTLFIVFYLSYYIK
jgi:hypothetical protein